MAIDFPASPTVGQEHASGGTTYVWNGTGWTVKGASTSDLATNAYVDAQDALKVAKAGDTMSGTLKLDMPTSGPQLKINKTVTTGRNNAITAYTNDLPRWQMNLGNVVAEAGNNSGSDFVIQRYNDVGVWIDDPLTINRATGQLLFNNSTVAAAPLDAMAYSGMQVNGSMDVHQTATGNVVFPSGTDEKFVVDNWMVSKTGTSVLDTYKTTTSMGGLPNCIQLNATTPQPTIGSDAVRFVTRIEGYRIVRLGWGTVNAKPVTASFWARFMLPGTYRAIILNDTGAAATGWVSFTITTSMVWQYVTVTFPAQTTGVWQADNRVGFYLAIEVASNATPNTVSAINQYAAITGFILIPGTQAPTAQQSPLIMRPYDQELMLCQRYYEKNPTFVTATRFSGNVTAGQTYHATYRFRQEKRAVPTMTLVNIAATNFPATVGSVSANVDGFYEGRVANGTSMGSFASDWVADARL